MSNTENTQPTEEQRPPFRLSSVASIKHLNVRKEGPEDDQILAVDVKLHMTKLDRAICAYFDPALAAFLWRGDTDALIVRNSFLGPVSYAHTISSVEAGIGMKTFHGCEVKKFQIEPRDGGVVDLTCSLTCYPYAGDVDELAKRVMEDVTVTLVSQQKDLFTNDLKPANGEGSSDDDDPMLDQARNLVVEQQKASISMVQRHLKIGYNRAARLLEALETAGIVSAMDRSGVRKVIN